MHLNESRKRCQKQLNDFVDQRRKSVYYLHENPQNVSSWHRNARGAPKAWKSVAATAPAASSAKKNLPLFLKLSARRVSRSVFL